MALQRGKIVTKNYPNPEPGGNVLLEIVAAAETNREMRQALAELPPGTYSIFSLNRAAVVVGEVPARKRVDLGPPTVTRKPKAAAAAKAKAVKS